MFRALRTAVCTLSCGDTVVSTSPSAVRRMISINDLTLTKSAVSAAGEDGGTALEDGVMASVCGVERSSFAFSG